MALQSSGPTSLCMWISSCLRTISWKKLYFLLLVVLESILSPFSCLGTLVKSQMTLSVRVISRLLNLLHWSICLSLCTLSLLLVLDFPDIHIRLTLLRLIISKQNNEFNKSQALDIGPRRTQNPVVILATVNEPDQKDFCLWFKGNLVFII